MKMKTKTKMKMKIKMMKMKMKTKMMKMKTKMKKKLLLHSFKEEENGLEDTVTLKTKQLTKMEMMNKIEEEEEKDPDISTLDTTLI